MKQEKNQKQMIANYNLWREMRENSHTRILTSRRETERGETRKKKKEKQANKREIGCREAERETHEEKRMMRVKNTTTRGKTNREGCMGLRIYKRPTLPRFFRRMISLTAEKTTVTL